MKAHVRYVALNTTQPEALATFYQSHFGMRRVAAAKSGEVALTDGWTKLVLLASWPAEDVVGLARYGIAIDDLDDLKDRLARTGRSDALQASAGGDFAGEYRILDLCGMPWEVSVTNFGLASEPENVTGVPRIRHMETSVPDTHAHMEWLIGMFDLEELNTSLQLRAMPNAFPLRQAGDGEMNVTLLPFDKAPGKRMSEMHRTRKWVGQHFGWVVPDMYGLIAGIPLDLRTCWTAMGNMAEYQIHDPDRNVMDLSQAKGYEVAFQVWERGHGRGLPPATLRMPVG